MECFSAKFAIALAISVIALTAQTVATPVRGGRLVVAQKVEPKTLNPAFSRDTPSDEVIGRLSGELLTIDHVSQTVMPALADTYHISADGLHYTLHLRSGLRFSDGQPFDADDVVFSFRVYQDAAVNAVQRDVLMIQGKPLTVVKLNAQTVRIDFPARYARGERLFDSLPMLPRHLLLKPYQDGTLNQWWGVNTKPEAMAGMGPFRVKMYQQGERLVLERNPYYWKAPEPYLNELVFLFVGDEDAQIAHFLSGETDILNRVSARNAGLLRTRGVKLQDLGPSLEYNFLVFNLTPDASAGPKEWFQERAFRQAVSAAIDRDAIVRIAYGGLGSALAANVSPGNRMWVNAKLAAPKQSREKAKGLLKGAGFAWNGEGALLDQHGKPVEFTVAVAANNVERKSMATLIQDDLKAIGMNVQIAPLQLGSLIDRVLNTHKYDTAVMGLLGTDPDPIFEVNVWKSSGGMHVWNPEEKSPSSSWEAEIDHLIDQQASEGVYEKRRETYNKVQEILADEAPLIFLASPHVLVAAQARVGNFRPTIFDHNTLWNADELFVSEPKEQPAQK